MSAAGNQEPGIGLVGNPPEGGTGAVMDGEVPALLPFTRVVPITTAEANLRAAQETTRPKYAEAAPPTVKRFRPHQDIGRAVHEVPGYEEAPLQPVIGNTAIAAAERERPIPPIPERRPEPTRPNPRHAAVRQTADTTTERRSSNVHSHAVPSQSGAVAVGKPDPRQLIPPLIPVPHTLPKHHVTPSPATPEVLSRPQVALPHQQAVSSANIAKSKPLAMRKPIGNNQPATYALFYDAQGRPVPQWPANQQLDATRELPPIQQPAHHMIHSSPSIPPVRTQAASSNPKNAEHQSEPNAGSSPAPAFMRHAAAVLVEAAIEAIPLVIEARRHAHEETAEHERQQAVEPVAPPVQQRVGAEQSSPREVHHSGVPSEALSSQVVAAEPNVSLAPDNPVSAQAGPAPLRQLRLEEALSPEAEAANRLDKAIAHYAAILAEQRSSHHYALFGHGKMTPRAIIRRLKGSLTNTASYDIAERRFEMQRQAKQDFNRNLFIYAQLLGRGNARETQKVVARHLQVLEERTQQEQDKLAGIDPQTGEMIAKPEYIAGLKQASAWQYAPTYVDTQAKQGIRIRAASIGTAIGVAGGIAIGVPALALTFPVWAVAVTVGGATMLTATMAGRAIATRNANVANRYLRAVEGARDADQTIAEKNWDDFNHAHLGQMAVRIARTYQASWLKRQWLRVRGAYRTNFAQPIEKTTETLSEANYARTMYMGRIATRWAVGGAAAGAAFVRLAPSLTHEIIAGTDGLRHWPRLG